MNKSWLKKRRHALIRSILVVFRRQIQQTDDKADRCDQNRVPKAYIRVAAGTVGIFAGIKQARGNERRQAAKNAVADVVWKGH